MGSGSSLCGSSTKSTVDPKEQEEKNSKLQEVLKQGGDLSEYTIADIAKVKIDYPPPVTPVKKKNEIFRSEDYDAVAENVIQISACLVSLSTRELVDKVTQNIEEGDEMSVVRALYLMVTAIDTSQLSAAADVPPEPNTPLEYLLQIKQLKGNHAHLFCALCKVAGITCQIVFGANKSAAYKLGQPVDKKKMAAQWNAVHVQGEWRLIDCFWSSACVVGGDEIDGEWDILDIDGKIVSGKRIAGGSATSHRINEFFFLTDPEALIATHLPRHQQWQLLNTESLVTDLDFQESVYRRERFFELGIQIPVDSQKKCILTAEHGTLNIELLVPDDSPSIDFKYMLFMAKGTAGDKKLEKFVIYERGTGSVKWTVNFPVCGQFKMDIFGKDTRKHNSTDLVCSYLINSLIGTDNVEPLPDDPAIGWGPDGGYCQAYGMSPVTHNTGVIETDDGIVDIKFNLDQPIELLNVMLSNRIKGDQLHSSAVLEIKENECIIHIRLPESGTYACELFANEEGITGALQNVCNYIIKCNKPVSNPLFPHVPNGRIGGTNTGKELAIEPLTLDPRMTTDENGRVKVEFNVPTGVDLHAEMHHNNLSTESANQQVTVNKGNSAISFNLDPSIAGEQCMAIYATVGEDRRVYNVNNYLINHPVERDQSNEPDGESKQSPSKKSNKSVENVELPPQETVRVKHGKAEVTLPHIQAEDITAELKKDRAVLGLADNQLVVEQQENKSKLTVKLPEDGQYELRVFEKKKKSGTVELKKRYQLIHEGGVYEPIALPVLTPEESLIDEQEPETEEAPLDSETDAQRQLREARETKWKLLRQSLVESLAKGDEGGIRKSMAAYRNGKVPNMQGIYAQAETLLRIIKARRDLNAAVSSMDSKKLESALAYAQSIKHRGKLDVEIAYAQRALEKVQRVAKLRHAVLKMDQRTIAEIKSFSQPPQAIYHVMRGTLLLLGIPTKELKDWKSIVVSIGKVGKESLKRRVMDFSIDDITPELKTEASNVLSQFTMSEIRGVSAGAATFYQWATGMLVETDQAVDELKDESSAGGTTASD